MPTLKTMRILSSIQIIFETLHETKNHYIDYILETRPKNLVFIEKSQKACLSDLNLYCDFFLFIVGQGEIIELNLLDFYK